MEKSTFLNKILVVAVRKSFWDSPDCEIFPNRIYIKSIIGHSQNLFNMPFALSRALFGCIIHRPKLILLSYPSIVPWFLILKKIGLLSSVKIVVINQGFLSTKNLIKCIDRIIVNSRCEISCFEPSLREKFDFILLPADGRFDLKHVSKRKDYIFTGGAAGRDFRSIIEAVRGLDVKLKIVTFSPKKLLKMCKIPGNCEVFGRLPLDRFLQMMMESKFVIVPLKKGLYPHGHTTVVQALCSGKAVITTENACVDDYISHGREGLLVPPSSIVGYRKSIKNLLENAEFLKKLEQNAKLKALNLTYAMYAERLVASCFDVMIS